MTSLFKKLTITSLSFIVLSGIVLSVGTSQPSEFEPDALNTIDNVRIFVARPSFWESSGALQLLRTADSASGLNNRNDGYQTFSIAGYTSDTYYDNATGNGGFDEYAVAGIVYYEIPYSAINGKWFDLVRLDPNNSSNVWNDVGNIQFATDMNHRILRIWGDGGGLVTNILGINAESRNISNNALIPILSGYLTCSSNSHNGYGAYTALRDNFNLEGRTGLSSINMTDFAWTQNGSTISYDYTNAANLTQTITLNAKVLAMKSQSGN